MTNAEEKREAAKTRADRQRAGPPRSNTPLERVEMLLLDVAQGIEGMDVAQLWELCGPPRGVTVLETGFVEVLFALDGGDLALNLAPDEYRRGGNLEVALGNSVENITTSKRSKP